ncbi:hypothetical protein [Arsenicicoccus dermatophilus]|uniref:hypothetical protein n=1 Tax=Arsenicicoccus dermatophilus TaxID=1076331 RepID=UPI001F4CABEE|nr:hypothetical protein [Arsenicicoccus dermatophilus]MCH8611963.1 hypothetical protein [Arsenicicoccus dermatophilus]
MSIQSRRSPDVTAAPLVGTELGRAVGEPAWQIIELGSFTHGECLECWWVGPGRRARSSARQDSQLHALTGCGDAQQILGRSSEGAVGR